MGPENRVTPLRNVLCGDGGEWVESPFGLFYFERRFADSKRCIIQIVRTANSRHVRSVISARMEPERIR